MKLLSNTNFGNHLKTLEISNSCYKMLRMKFDSFVSKKLELGMFVPCDEEGNVLNKPTIYYNGSVLMNLDGISLEIALKINDKVSIYEKAKERCLFEGLEFEDIQPSTEYNYYHLNGNKIFEANNQYKFFPYRGLRTIEDLVKYDLTLTKTAIKQIGL